MIRGRPVRSVRVFPRRAERPCKGADDPCGNRASARFVHHQLGQSDVTGGFEQRPVISVMWSFRLSLNPLRGFILLTIKAHALRRAQREGYTGVGMDGTALNWACPDCA
ncbi:hypothetical protein SAMN00790413_06064 [Deinococcus hopiensis KR-140]|uniref:Uncharacterized protein n=1 Tax=Deinococcus hopiensis KR-140 TaxID=695939 RepID=A0A1W1VW23_9DEIO|nr:hypothetical protein SAMN00790413_06064 [Deinococcus hopiensis KR-140]